MDRQAGSQSVGVALDCLSGGGETGAMLRSFDWRASPLGPVREWPQSLKTAVRIMLTSRQAMFVWWGDELINLYNDAYRSIVGGKHPRALGRPASEVWREIWDQVGPRAAWAMEKDEGTYDESLLLIMERHGYPEETYYTFSYSPVPNDRGGTGGIICANTDDTRRIVGERQLALLRDLAARTADARTFDEACTRAAASMESEPRDLPFALIYLVEPTRRRVELSGVAGIARGHAAAPESVELDGPGGWPFAEVVRTGRAVVVDGPVSLFGDLPTGAWDRPPGRAVLAPIAPSGHTGRSGILVAGLNPFRLFDADYRGFVELVAGQIAASIANAQAYEEERRRAEALAELDRAKTTFFSNVSHEFRTPLTLMLGPAEDALADVEEPLPPRQHERVEIIHRNALRLLKLVNTLLDFSRIEAGRVQAVYEPTDLAALTADLASVFRSAVERAGMELIVDCPPMPEPAYVDRDMWEKIVLNLVSNAFKFTLEGRIAVSLRDAGDAFRLAVEDTGTGIPADELPRLFERFHRVEGAQGRTHEGTGIGLALVQELARLHGGRVEAASTFGEGTTFTVTIPKGRDHLPADRIGGTRSLASTAMGATPYVEEAFRWLPDLDGGGSPPPGPEDHAGLSRHDALGRAGPGGERMRILLADDNADMREYVTRLLGERYDVRAVADGMQALAAVREQPPHLVLSDVMMPMLDGFGLLRELRSDPATAAIPILLLSARAGEEARVEGLERGADDYLTKPFGARELLARVAAHLELAQVRRNAARRERELRAEADAILESITDGFLALDRDWRICYINAEAERINGRPRAELIGRDHWELFPTTVGTHLEREFRRAVAEQVSVQLEHHYDPWGRWFEIRAYPSRDGGLAVYFRDVTERKASEAERERLFQEAQSAREQAETANRMKDHFLATLSHELRTPLSAIVGWSRLLRSGKLDEADVAQGLDAIDRNARVQTQLIEDLLDLSRIIAGTLRLDIQRVNLAEVIDAALATVQPAAEAKGLRVVKIVDSLAGPVAGDPARLQQIAWNLLSNAVKFTPKGGRIQVLLERVNSHVEITVTDTGIGIKPEFLPFVFDRFRQADGTTTRRHGGLGLGLSIVKQLVEMHGGAVRAKSPGEDRGSTFVVSLPLLVVHEEKESRRVQPREPAAGELEFSDGMLEGVSVLVVDDEPDARDLIRRVLAGNRARVQVAGSAPEALALIRDQKFDVLVSDIGLPDSDGYDLIRQVRARGFGTRDLPAAALTAFARPEDRRRALLAGFQVHVAKPVDPDELVAVVASLVGRTGGP